LLGLEKLPSKAPARKGRYSRSRNGSKGNRSFTRRHGGMTHIGFTSTRNPPQLKKKRTSRKVDKSSPARPKGMAKRLSRLRPPEGRESLACDCWREKRDTKKSKGFKGVTYINQSGNTEKRTSCQSECPSTINAIMVR